MLSLFYFYERVNMQQYQYNGPVVQFGKCTANNWKATTMAASEAQARNNFAYRYKKENGLMPYAKITLPGQISVI